MRGEFQNGNVGIHPGSFRKSGKQRTYGIRNLEECVAQRKQGICKSAFLHEYAIRERGIATERCPS